MNALEIKQINKSFPGFTLKDVSLTLPSGCIMGLIGENGAGKSTTMKLILNRLRPDSGKITVLGQELSQDPLGIKVELGVVMDEVGIPDCLTAAQVGHIMAHTYHNWDDQEFARLLKKFSLPEKKPFKEFSRGMKMKLGIAVAMSHHAKLLLLDEATSGLDPVVRDEVVEMLGEFTRDESHAVFISSHIVSDLEKLCDYVAFLHKGKLLLCAEKDLLLSEYGILHCPAQQLNELDQAAILSRRITMYGAEAIVRRDVVPSAWAVSPVTLEELFVCMAREGEE